MKIKKIITTKFIPGLLATTMLIGGVNIPFTNNTPFQTLVVNAEEPSTTKNIILHINKPENISDNVFLANDGDENATEITTETVTLPVTENYMTLPQLSLQGYTFDGWYSNEALTDENKIHGSIAFNSISFNAYAKWIAGENANDFTVTLDANGGVLIGENNTEVSSLDVTCSPNVYVQLPTPTREGYKFLGWYDGDEKVTVSSFSSSTTLTAHWNKLYTITLDVNGGRLHSSASTSYNFVQGETIFLPTPAKTGHKFLGWYVGDELLTDTYTYADNITAVACYEIKTYNITYENVDGWENTSPTSYKYGDSVTLIAPTKEGYVFDGWYDKYAEEENPSPVSGISAGSCVDFTFVAHWHQTQATPETNDTITITLNTNGGNPIKSITATKGQATILPTPTRSGYKFDGWYDNDTKVSSVVTLNEDKTLVAHWTESSTNPTEPTEPTQAEIKETAKTKLAEYSTPNTYVVSGSSIRLPEGAIVSKDGEIVSPDTNGILSLTEGTYAVLLPNESDIYRFVVRNKGDNPTNSINPTDTNTNDAITKQAIELAKTALEGLAISGVKIGDSVAVPTGTVATLNGQNLDLSSGQLSFDKAGTYAIVLPDGSKYLASVSAPQPIIQATATVASATEAKSTPNTTVKITKATANKKAATVKFKKVDKATGYEIQVSKKSNMKTSTTYTTKKTTYKIKKLATGNRYYIRVRAFTKNADGTKTYYKWSTKKRTKAIK